MSPTPDIFDPRQPLIREVHIVPIPKRLHLTRLNRILVKVRRPAPPVERQCQKPENSYYR